MTIAIGVWYLFPYTISRSERYRTSALDMLIKRSGTAIAAGIFGGATIGALLTKEATHEIHQSSSQANDNPSSRKSINLMPPTQENKNYTPPASLQSESNSTAPLQTVSPRIFSEEEIMQLEEAKQYHGDDPIIRARLGIPSRATGKIEK